MKTKCNFADSVGFARSLSMCVPDMYGECDMIWLRPDLIALLFGLGNPVMFLYMFTSELLFVILVC